MTNTENNTPEHKITRKVIRALKAAGTPVVAVWDREERIETPTEHEAMEAVFAVDEAWLLTASGSWVRITLGNEWDALTDYTVDLEDTIAPVSDWAGDQDAASR
jgi:hypothetical protein